MKNNLNIKTTIVPEKRMSEQDWFKEFRVSSLVQPKTIPLDRHVFDMERFVHNINGGQKEEGVFEKIMITGKQVFGFCLAQISNHGKKK